MKRSIALSAAILAAALTATVTAHADDTTTYDFSGFDEIDVAAGIEVIYMTKPDYSVTAKFHRGGPEDLKVRQEGERLYISKKMKSGWGDNLRVTVTVTSPKLTEIEASSGSSVSASDVAADSFTLKASSGASAEVTGTCGAITVKASSGGSADARGFKCEDVSASASSGGSVEAYASKSATSKTSSGGSVDIWGNPASRDANESISGGSTDFH